MQVMCAHNFLLLYGKYPSVVLGHMASVYIDFLNHFYVLSLLLDFDSVLFYFYLKCHCYYINQNCAELNYEFFNTNLIMERPAFISL